MTIHPTKSVSQRELRIHAEYGELLSVADLARLLKYPSPQALRKARIRGALRLPMLQMPGRRGWFATAQAVAAYLDALDTGRERGKEVRLERL